MESDSLSIGKIFEWIIIGFLILFEIFTLKLLYEKLHNKLESLISLLFAFFITELLMIAISTGIALISGGHIFLIVSLSQASVYYLTGNYLYLFGWFEYPQGII